MCEEVSIKTAELNDAEDFVNLVLRSAPLLFPVLYEDRLKDILRKLFIRDHNLFNFQHTYFAEISGKKVGMILGYDWKVKKQENLQTGLLLLKYMGFDFIKRIHLFMKVNDALGWIFDREYYISNVAVYPEYSGMGIGTSLIVKIENEARMNEIEKVGLDVEVENAGAIRLYKRLGYTIIKKTSIKLYGQLFQFCRLYKELRWQRG